VVGGVERGGADVMTIVPLVVCDASIVCVVLNDLLFSDLEARSVFKITVCKVE